MTTTMSERTDGRDVPSSHNLGRCDEQFGGCGLAFHWHRAEGVTCPKCGRGLDLTTRRLRAGFLPLTKEDVKAIQDANGYTAIAPELRTLRRQETDYNKRTGALTDAAHALEWVEFTDSKGQTAKWHYTHPEAPLTAAEKAARTEQIDAYRAQRQELYDSEGRERGAAISALWKRVKGVPVDVSCFRPAAPEPVAAPVVSERQRRQERIQAAVDAGIDAILGPVTEAAPEADPFPAITPQPAQLRKVSPGHKWAGEVKRVKSVTGTTAVLVDIRKGGEWIGSEADGGRWVTTCDDHATVCQHRTRELAEGHLAEVAWCEACQETLKAKAEAAKPKGTWGGARQGAGRKPVGADVKVTSVSLPASMLEAIKRFGGGNLSAGVRRLHDEYFQSLGEGV
jgi:hypothetical protein